MRWLACLKKKEKFVVCFVSLRPRRTRDERDERCDGDNAVLFLIEPREVSFLEVYNCSLFRVPGKHPVGSYYLAVYNVSMRPQVGITRSSDLVGRL